MTQPTPYDRPFRLERSLLSVPATTEKFFAKAAASIADTVMLDLEDAVAPERKAEGRAAAIRAVNTVDWGRKTVAVRMNPLDTPWGYRDLIEVAEGAGRLDLVMVPKVDRPEDVVTVETLLQAVELATGRKPVGIAAQVESVASLHNVERIAAVSPRLEAVHFGPGDFAASLGNRVRVIGGPDPDYGVLAPAEEGGPRARHANDVWHYTLARIAVACKAYGVRVVDGPYVDFKDEAGFRDAARRVRALGFDGKWAIHPSQLALAHEYFGPSAEEIAWAHKLLDAMAEAHATGIGAIGVDGEMIDMAHVRMAQRIQAQAEQMGAW